MNRLFVNNARAHIFKSHYRGDWVAYCPCDIPPLIRGEWREAIAALHKHMKEVHL